MEETEAMFWDSVDEEQRSRLEKYLLDIFGVRLTPKQKKALESPVYTAEGHRMVTMKSPVALFDTDEHFPAYVNSRIKWACDTSHGKTNAVKRTKAVYAIRKYATPRFGWIDFKKEALGHGCSHKSRTERTDSKREPSPAREKDQAEGDRYASQLTGFSTRRAKST